MTGPITIIRDCPIRTSPRVLQLAGMFDVPIDAKLTTRTVIDMPIGDRPWSVGMIVGPSGSGKTTVARHLWPDHLAGEQVWDSDAALVDGFPASLGVREVVGLLTAVGLGSPPAWMRPFRTLSNGEAFRATIARALAESPGLVVVDEFTSVVDRQVARVASHAIQKTVRRGSGRFVAVSCHYDIEAWLQPDWIYDLGSREFRWRLVQPHPPITLDVFPVHHSLWSLFAHHHYLSADINPSARCYAGWIGPHVVAFTAYLHFAHPKTRNIKMGHRLVVLPDYQGLGIGGRLDDWLGQHLWEQGFRYRNVIAHPALINYYTMSPRWTEHKVDSTLYAAQTRTAAGRLLAKQTNPRIIGLRSFEYRAPKG